jgi:protein required for attachment to host cells
MKRIWVIVGNFDQVYIYSISEKDLQIQLVEKLIHKENKLKKSDLVSDKPGNYAKGFNSNIVGSYGPTTDPKSVEKDNFIKNICKILEKGRNDRMYVGIIIVSEPNFYGLIKQFANKNLIRYIKHHEAKDYCKISEKKIKNIIQTNLYKKIKLIFLN